MANLRECQVGSEMERVMTNLCECQVGSETERVGQSSCMLGGLSYEDVDGQS